MSENSHIPILLTCQECHGTGPSIENVTVSQNCSRSDFGAIPGVSTEAVTGTDENGETFCITPASIHSPEAVYVNLAEECNPQRYMTVTEVDRSGGVNHGRTAVTQYAIVNGVRTSTTTYSGTRTTVTTINGSRVGVGENSSGIVRIGESTTTETETVTFNSNGTTTVNVECQGSSSASDNASSSCVSTYSKVGGSCAWQGTITQDDGYGEGVMETVPFDGNCLDAGFMGGESEEDPEEYETTVTITPPVTCTITTTYTNPTPANCSVPNLPAFPAFPQLFCQEGEQEPINYLPGQGSETNMLGYAARYVNADAGIDNIVNAMYRAVHVGTKTCYLEVWFRKKIQSMKYEDCDTGFPGDPPRTAALSVDCTRYGGVAPCFARWSTNGAPTYENIADSYIWDGNYPCLDACISSPERSLTAEENTVVTLEYKYSNVKNYEPDWPDENGCQGCRPNGFPTLAPSDCCENGAAGV